MPSLPNVPPTPPQPHRTQPPALPPQLPSRRSRGTFARSVIIALWLCILGAAAAALYHFRLDLAERLGLLSPPITARWEEGPPESGRATLVVTYANHSDHVVSLIPTMTDPFDQSGDNLKRKTSPAVPPAPAADVLPEHIARLLPPWDESESPSRAPRAAREKLLLQVAAGAEDGGWTPLSQDPAADRPAVAASNVAPHGTAVLRFSPSHVPDISPAGVDAAKRFPRSVRIRLVGASDARQPPDTLLSIPDNVQRAWRDRDEAARKYAASMDKGRQALQADNYDNAIGNFEAAQTAARKLPDTVGSVSPQKESKAALENANRRKQVVADAQRRLEQRTADLKTLRESYHEVETLIDTDRTTDAEEKLAELITKLVRLQDESNPRQHAEKSPSTRDPQQVDAKLAALHTSARKAWDGVRQRLAASNLATARKAFQDCDYEVAYTQAREASLRAPALKEAAELAARAEVAVRNGLLFEFDVGSAAIAALQLDRHGERLLCLDKAGQLELRVLGTRRAVFHESCAGVTAVSSAAISPDLQHLAAIPGSAFASAEFKLFKVLSGGPSAVTAFDASNSERTATSLAFTPEGQSLLTGNNRGIYRWDLATPDAIKPAQILSVPPMSNDPITALVVDGQSVIAGNRSGKATGALMLDRSTSSQQIPDAEILALFSAPVRHLAGNRRRAVAIGDKGQGVVFGREFDRSEKELTVSRDNAPLLFLCVAWGGGPSFFTGHASGFVAEWNWGDLQSGQAFAAHGSDVTAIAAATAGDRRWLATGSRDGEVKVWNLSARRAPPPVPSVPKAPDGES